MKRSHEQLLQMVSDNLRFSGVPEKALTPLAGARREPATVASRPRPPCARAVPPARHVLAAHVPRATPRRAADLLEDVESLAPLNVQAPTDATHKASV